MKKKFYFFLIFGIFVLVIVGVLVYWGFSKDEDRVTSGVKYEAPKYYVIKDGPDGKIVENKHAGINLKAPQGWNVEKKEIGPNEWIVNFNSPDLTTNETGFLASGCGLSAWVEYDEITSGVIQDSIGNPSRFSQGISGTMEVVDISGHQGLKTIYDRPEWGTSVIIQIPVKDKIYSLDTLLLPDEKERCSALIDKFFDDIFIY
jgi:hypothetical protein